MPGRLQFALVLLAVYLYGTDTAKRDGARARDSEQLRRRILDYVKQQPGPAPVTLQKLRKAGIVSDQDLEFLRQNNLSYHPISARSPSDALFFVARRGNTESRYYKGGRMDYVATWPSPDHFYAVVSAPNPRDHSQRMVSVVENATQRVLGTLETSAHAVLSQEAVWSPDQRYVAINLPVRKKGMAANFIDCACVFEVLPNAARTILVPPQLRPAALIDPADVARGVQWCDHWVKATGWQGANTLRVESEGRGRIGNLAQRPMWSFHFLYCSQVRLHRGAATILTTTPKYFVKTESN
jgi:hypothetical protein